MRRPLALACALAFPLTWAVASNGCGGGTSDPDLEDACGFLATDGNCVESFYGAVGNSCGGLGKGNGPTGSFLMRAMLDVCILDAGGQVVFDPPLDPTMFPPAAPVGFKILTFTGNECANGSFSADGTNFSIAVDPYPPDGGVAGIGGAAASSTGSTTGAGGAGGGTTGAGSPGQMLTAGGSLSIAQTPGRAVFDLTCNSGAETHHFSNFQLAEDACTFKSEVPHADVELNAGGVDRAGWVRFRVYYEAPAATATSDTPVVEYFNCAIPAAPEPCFDGVQDIGETDVDCGGPTASCVTRCPDGAKCSQTSDCVSNICSFKMGLKTCGM